MYCQKCGKGEQETDTFCRQCGEYLVDVTNFRKRGFRAKTPDENIRMSLFLNLLSSVVSFVMAILLYATHLGRPDTPAAVFLAAGLFIVIGVWQMINFLVGLRIKKYFDKRKDNPAGETAAPSEPEIAPASGSAELLTEAGFEDIVPASVTENTTKNLTEKIPDKFS